MVFSASLMFSTNPDRELKRKECEEGEMRKGLRALDPVNRIGFRRTRPDLKLGELLLQALGQVLDAEAFRGVMSRQHQGQFVSLGGQVIVKASLAGDEDVGLGSDGVHQELAAGAARQSHALD